MTKNEYWFEKLGGVTPWGSQTCSKRARLIPEEPAVIVRGKGCRVWDADGKEFIDYRNGLGPVTLGYCFPEVDEAIIGQLKQGIIFSHPSPLEYEVAERITGLREHFGMVKFLKTGGEACAAAIKIARGYTGKSHVIHIGYNGWLNSLSRGGKVLPRQSAQAVGEVKNIPGVPPEISDLHHGADYGDNESVKILFENYENEIAAVVISCGYADFYKGDPFYKQLREICTKNDALLICDEIVTGFRIATAGASEFFVFESDISVFAKGFANGMPISAVAGRKEIMSVCDFGGGVVISSTYAGELLSLAAAKTVIDIYKNRDVIGHMKKIGRLFADGANRLFGLYGIPLKYTGADAMATLTETESSGTADIFTRLCYKHGLSLYFVIYPNFSHTEKDLYETLDKMEKAVGEMKK